ncbi:MAG: TolC family protein, partial [Bacteroidia bacterium]|nr:TolC family protein [Bacteroidia bacterium]
NFYTRATRFDGIQLGIGIPLFFGSQRSKVAAANKQIKIVENESTFKRLQLQNDLQAALVQYSNNSEIVNYFEVTQLPNVETISQTTTLQYAAGEINYSEWVMLNNQVIQIRSNYLDALKKLNDSISQINFLTTK